MLNSNILNLTIKISNILCKNEKHLTRNIYTIHYRTMFTFKKFFNKGQNLSHLFQQKSCFTTQAVNSSNNLQESELDLALTVTKYFQTIFSPTPTEFLSQLSNLKNGLLIYKMITYAKIVPNPFIAKKFFQITYKKESLIFPKNTIIETVKMVSSSSNLKNLQIENTQEKSSTSGVYEVYTGELFTNQLNNVHIITYKSENPNNVNQETQKKSLTMTGQKNCDVEVTFKTKLGNSFNSFFDILIGKNKYYKGNLIQTNINDISEIEFNLNKIFSDIQYQEVNLKTQFSPIDKKTFYSIIHQLNIIYKNHAITPQSKTLLVQQQLVELIPLVRKYNNSYNPHFLVFFEENNLENEKIKDIANRIQKIFPKSINSHSSNEIFENVFKNAIPIFVEHYHVDWKLLSLADREHCLGLMKKFTPELYIEIMTKL